ncbi:hypothetical protein BVC80_1831g223 [Macleaya cordata]|uniref:DnaJ domain n=1 Tax=Macleaya cordata TaxID=56857 RepID=A0A200R7I0_MACCD|nr:hypothetical protein BVC80_1831g223 [Macleaya cordata]
MERFSLREHVLLGSSSSPRRSFGSPKNQSRNADLDFNDVFGGPPRRSSMHEWRNSLGEAMNSNSSGGDEEDLVSSRSPWSGLSEKPVFGEENLNRRSFPSDDFFDDIFRGDSYSASTPTRPSRDHFSSTPGSRVLSPARSLPPQSEPFGGSSLPILLSLPAKLTKGMDQAFTTPSHSPFKTKESASNGLGFPSSPSASRVLSQVVQGQEDLRNDAHASSRGIYLKSEGSSKAIKSDKQDTQATLKKDLSNSEVSSNGFDQFHFSIYKWPGKGVPFAMLLQGRNNVLSKERGKTEGIESEFSTPVVQGAEVSGSAGLNTMKKDTIGSSKFVEEVVPVKPESEPIISSLSHNAGKGITPDSGASGAPMDIGLCEVTEKGKDKMVKQAGMKEGAVKRIDTSSGNVDSKKVKKLNGKRNLLNLGEATSSSMQESSVSKEEKLVGSRVKGKVKEFVQIFNQETPSKQISSVETIVQSTGVKDVGASKTEDQTSVYETKADEKEKMVNLKNKRISIDTPVMEDQVLDKSEKPHVGINKTSRKIYDTSSERNDNSTSCSEAVPEVFGAVVDNMEESHYEDLQGNCLVEELSPEHNKHSQTAQRAEEIQASDAKIRKWSNGKQGNIRSLLSTLQYVLWPESGWKPVPLVDIIEGNSVRRAYQKALLCLHPDKLQQKGAAEHQKYIAEKVFDILQEAWTHFNNLGSF